ncbi:MAG: hypothetical protein ABIP75_00850, partial [Pyrinomonadaceae bacterium]
RNELVVNQRDNPWPAVGTYRRVITFYYTYGDREKDPYPSRLLKVTVFTNRSDQQEFESYTFNRHEQLIFAQSRTDDEPPAEQTYYFAANRLIGRWNKGEKVSVNTVDANSNSASVRSTAGKLDNVFRASLD